MTAESEQTSAFPVLRGRAAHLDALRRIVNDMVGRVHSAQLLQDVLEQAVKITAASGGVLSILETNQDNLITKASLNAAFAPDQINLNDPRGMEHALVSGIRIEHHGRLINLPLHLSGLPVGLVQLFRAEPEPPFETHDLEWIEEINVLAVMAVDHVRLRDEVNRDLSVRQQREAELHRQLREIRLLRQISFVASASLEPLVVLTAICRELAGAIGVPQAAFARLADDGSHLLLVAEHRPLGVVGLGIVIPLANNSITLDAIASRQPVAVFDAQNDPRMGEGRASAARLGIQSMLIVPIGAGNEVIGTLGLDSLEPRVFTDEDIRLAQTVASAAAPALEHARLFEALKQELSERQRIETALRASQARQRALIDAVPDAIYRLGSDTRIIDARIPGRSAERLIGKRLSDVLPQAVAQRALDAVHQAQQQRIVQVFDERLEPELGEVENLTYRDVELRFAPIADDSVVMLERDITTRKQAERDLLEHRERFQELVDSVDGVVWEFRLRDGLPYLEFVSRRAEQLLGVPVAQLLGDHRWMSVIHPNDREMVLSTARQAIKARCGCQITHRVIDTAGVEHWILTRTSLILERDRVVGMRCLSTDFTARKQAEQLEADRNQVLELTARGNPLGDIMGLISAMLVRQFPDAACGIFQLGPGNLRMLGATGFGPGFAQRLQHVSLGSSGGPLGLSAVTAETVDVFDVLHDQRWTDAWQTGVLDEGFRSLSSVPIRSSTGSAMGVLTMLGRRPGLGTIAIEQMMAAADLASIALEKHLLSERLEFQALHDALTGLPNRSLFADRLAHALTQAERHRTRVALMYVDLDGFKPVNDQFGHSVGDALLREVATRLVHCVRASDTVARLGGDEFCVILSDLETIEQAVPVALKIVQTVGSIARLGEREVQVDSSVGLAVYPDHAEDADALYRLSDQAMYRAKNAGGHRVAIHAREDVFETQAPG
jgi:diguanylate cyclase (GGDEF)-like protein/PAS domain S-box-containing protein